MSRFWVIILGLIVIVAIAGFAITAPHPLAANALPDHTPDEENGALVFWASGCGSCHAAPGAKEVADKMLLGGGLEFKTPFGTFTAPNISPDPEVGIGGWTTLEFVNAVTRGISPDGSHYYPAFPYGSYQYMTLEDVIDLKAFMDTLQPVANAPAGHDVGFPFNIRRGIGGWKILAMDPGPRPADPNQSDAVNRGAYLVNGPGHCAECHTPRSMLGLVDTPLGPLDKDRWMAGALNPEDGERAPNLTPHDSGLSGWSAKDVAGTLSSGFLPDYSDTLGGRMGPVVFNMGQLPPEDLEAMGAYLLSLPARPDAAAGTEAK